MDEAQKALVVNNVALARFLARLVWMKNPNGMDLDEVVSVAYQGLVTAALRWSPEGRAINPEDLISGKAFSGFARQRIIGSIIDWQRGVDHVQRSYRGIYKLLTASGLGQGATIPDLMVTTGLTSEKIRSVIQAVEATPISMDSPPDQWEDFPDYSLDIPAVQNVEASALETSIKNSAVAAFQTLPKLHQTIVALRYYENIELQTIAGMLGLGLTTVRDAHSEAILTVHAAMLHKVNEPV
jgi:RNA polymerase sigma factor (sigma-70 family)